MGSQHNHCSNGLVILHRPGQRHNGVETSIMGQVQDLFRTSSVKQITLTEGNDLFQTLTGLIPWEISKIQVARAPAARRLPVNFPYTHRAAVIWHLESEDIQNVAFPRQRFAKPVKYAILAYGNAPTDEEDSRQPETEVPQSETRGAEISFPDCRVPRDIKRAVARLHVNLGHPTSTDLVRMLVLHGSITTEALSAAKKLKCASCERMRQLPHNRPSKTVKYLGQLNNNILADLFYARNIKGENFTLLGIIDESTGLHQVRILQDKNPDTILEAIQQMWIRPYGMPYKITLDQEGGFQGITWEHLARQGVEVDYVPPEAHHRMGKVERILNRTADATGAVTTEEMNEAVDSCIHAVNSMPRSRGMSPYACVFGQVPRVPGEILTDAHSLAVDVDGQQHRLRSMIFRAEAQKAAADVNVDTHLRRALLRKTAHMRVDDIPIGGKVAVWREQLRGKSTKKRGGYVIGRLITWDGTCAWVQIGWQTVKVDRAQMRPALGFENWTPDTDDITALKQAEQNFLDGEVEEDHSDPPPLDEPIVPQVMDYGTYGAEGSDILRLPEAVGAYQRSEGIQSEPYGPSRRTSKISSIGAPTPYSKPDAANKPLPELAPRPSQSESSQGIKRAVEQELPDSDSQETKRIAVEDVGGEPTPAGDPTQAPAATTTLPPVPEERVGASDALLGLVETNPGQFELDEPGDDGSPPLAARSERMINLPEVFKSEYDGPTLDADDMDQKIVIRTGKSATQATRPS